MVLTPEQNAQYLKAMGEIEKSVEKQEYECLFPDCRTTAIRSHSQQREGQLRSIAEDGIVYAPFLNLYRVFKEAETRSRARYNRMGIGEASVFQGYCAQHDKQLFCTIESETLKHNDTEQAFCLYLRAVSYEYCRKRRGLYRQTEAIRKCKDIIRPKALHFGQLFKQGQELYLRRDGSYYLRQAFEMFNDGETSELVTQWYVVPKNLQISTCICVNPLLEEYGTDPSGLREDRIQPNLTFNIIPEQNQTHIVASWLPEHDSACSWVSDAFQSERYLELLVNRFAFCESEETCVNPSFWESLPEETRVRALTGLSDLPPKKRTG